MGGLGLILAPSIAIGQIDPGDPDPHEPPALLVPRRLEWNFSEDTPSYVHPSFAAKQGFAFGTTPMFGKIRLVRDMVGTAQAPNNLGWPVVADEGRNGSNILLIEGDALRFHADAPFLGSISLWFREKASPPTGQWTMMVGGVRFGALYHQPYDNLQVAKDGHLGCGRGERETDTLYPSANHLNSGYNPLHPVVGDRIVEIVQDLSESLGPFKKGSGYSGDIGFASVDNVALLISERTRTSLLMHPNMGNIWDGAIPIDPEDWWKQSDWSYDDKTWELYLNHYPNTPDPPQGVNRFVWRHGYVTASQQLWDGYRQVRHYHLALLYKDMIDALGANGPNLALLYQAPSYPAVSITPGLLEPRDPRLARDFLDDGIALAATIHTYMGPVPSRDQRDRRGRMTYVPAIYSMRNTRYQWPADDGRRHGFDHLPMGWATAELQGADPPYTYDQQWRRQRWADFGTRALDPDLGNKSWRDYTLDLYLPPHDPQSPPKVGGWVYHDFIEPWTQAPPQYHTYGWGLATSGRGPWFGTNAEPADVMLSWAGGKHPVFTQKQGPNSTPAWSIPYGSFYDYFKQRLNPGQGNAIQIEMLLLGGWDTTSLYGHEHTLYDAINGGT